MGFDVDDDNEPAPENVPTEEVTTEAGLKDNQQWGTHPFDPRKASNAPNPLPSLEGLPKGERSKSVTLLWMFEKLMGRSILESVILPATNRKLASNNYVELSYGEFLTFIGIWFLMATQKVGGCSRRDYWSEEPISHWNGAPFRLNSYMSRNRFEQIISNLKYTVKPQSYIDRFHEIRQIISCWNTNIQSVFKSGWVTCLDESMSIWFNRWTCPGWMFVPRKPHPFGNEYHTICCGVTGIMFGIDLVEGKDRPTERPLDENANLGSTVSLLLRMCKPLYSSGKVVVLDSGFCVLKGIIKLAECGVYAAAQIKKRRYWPAFVPGEAIKEKMQNNEVGSMQCVKGTLNSTPYFIFNLKEPDYISSMMSTYGSIFQTGRNTTRNDTLRGTAGFQAFRFKYNDVFDNHFLYRHIVDDHNHLRHLIPSIEQTWSTCHWPNRVFAFLLAITEVNMFKAMTYFIWTPLGMLDTPKDLHTFRKYLAFELINNPYIEESIDVAGEGETRRKSRRLVSKKDHCLETAPFFAENFVAGKLKCTSPSQYAKHRCKTRGCKKRVRTYCSCSVGAWMCNGCFGDHRAEESTCFVYKVSQLGMLEICRAGDLAT